MKISSWNVNSVRARIINILDYINSEKPDVLFLQETKTEDINFPFDDFKRVGYGLIPSNVCHIIVWTTITNIKI